MAYKMELNGKKVVDWEMDLYGATQEELNPYKLLFTDGEFEKGIQMTGLQLEKLSRKYPDIIYRIIKKDLAKDSPLHAEFANYVPVEETPAPALDEEQRKKIVRIIERASIYFSCNCQERIYISSYDSAEPEPGEDIETLGFLGWGEETEDEYEILYNEIDLDLDYFYETIKIDIASA